MYELTQKGKQINKCRRVPGQAFSQQCCTNASNTRERARAL